MPLPETVVGKHPSLRKPELHAKLMVGWSRAIAKLGKGGFADALEISSTALDKQLSGSLPSAEVLDRALDAEPTVFDDWLGAKGKKLVDKNAVSTTDDALVTVTQLAAKIAEAAHPDSPGGRGISHCEYLSLENLMREMHHLSGAWLEECGRIRGPRAVA